MRRIARISTDTARALPRPGAALLLLLVAACGSAAPDRPSPTTAAAQIEAMLHASAEDWNRGDLQGYMDDYAADATFVGATGLVRGADQIRRRYEEGYWSAGTPPETLSFELLDVRMTGPDTGVVIGRYVLRERDTRRQAATGFFSLMVERRNGEWKILHDHSSAADPG